MNNHRQERRKSMRKVLEMQVSGKVESPRRNRPGQLISGRWVLAGLLLFSVTASAGEVPVSYPKADIQRDVAASVPYRGVAASPDCAAATPLTITADYDSTLNDDTTGRPSLVDSYGCETWDESGPEAVFALQVDEDVLPSVMLDSPLADLDVFLLSECDSDSCLAAHISQFMVELPARAAPYYLIVDGFQGAAGAFNLTLTAMPGLLDAQACDDAAAVACEVVSLSGNIFEQPNLVTMADCGSYLAFGGEDWFELTLSDGAELDIEVVEQTFDAVLWLFDDCGSDPVCLDYADRGLSGESEELFLVNESGAEITVLLGVDASRAFSAENGDIEFDGAFNLSISCSVPVAVEEKSFGDLKSLFR